MSVDIQFNVDQALAKLGELVAKHGPEAVNLATSVMQVSAIGDIATGLVLGGGAAIAGIVGLRLWSESARRYVAYKAWDEIYDAWRWKHDRVEADKPIKPAGIDGYEARQIAAIASGAVAAGFGLGSIRFLCNVWSWVAVIQPKLALAHHVLVKMGAM